MARYMRFIQPRDMQGRFGKFESDVTALMEAEAKAYQAEVAAYIDAHIGANSGRWAGERKAQSLAKGSRLVKATEDAENRDVGAATWRVGIPSHLNSSVAKYWRAIEFGSADAGWRTPFTQMPIFFNTALPITPFRSVGGKTKQRTLFGSGGPSSSYIFPREDFPGQHAYQAVFEQNGWADVVRKDLKQILGRNFGY